MGRIEDAIEKLQKAGGTFRASAGSRVERPPERLATVVAQPHAYAGKHIRFNRAALAAQGLLAPDVEERALAEQYRTIKRPLLRNAEPDHEPKVDRGNLLMVASALPGEGKTFTCVNLCLSIARESDWDVVLVDGDCSKPHLTRLFSADKERGLIDLLRDPSLSFDSLVMPTDIEGLSLLPAGTPDRHASELLASSRMDAICEGLAKEAGRMIVFDSSPLLLTTEAVALASKVGQIALVVRANSTLRQAVRTAVDKLEPNKAVACILNQTYRTEFGLDYGDYG
jgi:exopolysaccharide/PEP-CTERM locus tyrosine autokinase